MILASTITVLALGYVGTEIVLSLAGSPPLIASPAQAYEALLRLPAAPPAVTVPAGVAAGVVGIALILLAVLPGRRARHQLTTGARAVVADNGVIAAAIAHLVSAGTGLPRDLVRVGISHRTADITLRPSPGEPVDTRAVEDLVTAELRAYGLAPDLRIALRVQRSELSRGEG